MFCCQQFIVFNWFVLMISGSALSQTLCNRKVDKNGFQISEIDLLCDFSHNAKSGTKPKLIENLFNGFDFQRLGADNSWVFRFRDRFGKVRSLVMSNIEKNRQLFSYPRNMFGNYEEVIGDTEWDPTPVKDSIGKLLNNNKNRVDFGISPSVPSLTFGDIWRSIWRPKDTMVSDLQMNANYMTTNKRKSNDNNREMFAKSLPMFGKSSKVYDKQYLDLMTKINDLSKVAQNSQKLIEVKTEQKSKTEESILKSNISDKQSIDKKFDNKFNPKGIQLNKNQNKTNKQFSKHMLKSGPKYTKSVTDLMPSETDKHVMNQSLRSQTDSSPPLKHIPSARHLNGRQSKIFFPQKLTVPKIVPPRPIINPTSVLSRPMDFAQTILPEPTSDMDTFTYRDAVIGEESTQLSQLLPP